MGNRSLRRPVYGAVCLALCLVLPFLTGQIQTVGKMLAPMHLPVLLAGFLCGPWWAGVIGIAAPFLRFVLFGMPPVWPTGIAMAFELATYGLVCGLLYRRLPRRPWRVWVCLLPAMLAGRILWGIVRSLISGAGQEQFTWIMFLTGGFVNSAPGILLQLIIVPAIVLSLERTGHLKD